MSLPFTGDMEIDHSPFGENMTGGKRWETGAVRKIKTSGKNKKLSKLQII